jgi:uncharacterized membrane protein YccC
MPQIDDGQVGRITGRCDTARVFSTGPIIVRLPSFGRWVSPYFIHQHYAVLHAFRVALAFLTSLHLVTLFDIPHGAWMLITVLVVIGSLPHLGSVFRKAGQRIVGTLIGGVAGILAIVLHRYSVSLSYGWMVLFAGLSSYFALGRADYIALLSGITMAVVAGYGDNDMNGALWRSANVLAGALIALGFASLLPQKAVNHWKYLLADNLREAGMLYARLRHHELAPSTEIEAAFASLNSRLTKQRTLFAAVRKEVPIGAKELEHIQLLQRGILTTLDLLSETGAQRLERAEHQRLEEACEAEQLLIKHTLLGMAHALRFDRPDRLQPVQDEREYDLAALPSTEFGFEGRGYLWLTLKLLDQVERLNRQILDSAPYWCTAGLVLGPPVEEVGSSSPE